MSVLSHKVILEIISTLARVDNGVRLFKFR